MDKQTHTPANARLIAAAPDLLAALRDLLADIENGSDVPGAPSVHGVKAARAALAKVQS